MLILSATTPSIQLYLSQLKLGILSLLSVDNNRVGGHWPHGIQTNSFSAIRMPKVQRMSDGNYNPRTPYRLEMIFRFVIRISRHGQMHEDGPVIRLNPKREALMGGPLSRRNLPIVDIAEEDLRRLANDDDDRHKKRIRITYGNVTRTYLVGAHNGRSLPLWGFG